MNRTTMFDMHRTEHPKVPHYFSDGKARDSFIRCNNGGFMPTVHAQGQSGDARWNYSPSIPKHKRFGSLVNPA